MPLFFPKECSILTSENWHPPLFNPGIDEPEGKGGPHDGIIRPAPWPITAEQPCIAVDPYAKAGPATI